MQSVAALDKKMRRQRSNAALFRAYKSAADSLSKSEDPASLGKRLHGEYAAFYEYRLAGSYRLVYSIDRPARRVVLVNVGDHKQCLEETTASPSATSAVHIQVYRHPRLRRP